MPRESRPAFLHDHPAFGPAQGFGKAADVGQCLGAFAGEIEGAICSLEEPCGLESRAREQTCALRRGLVRPLDLGHVIQQSFEVRREGFGVERNPRLFALAAQAQQQRQQAAVPLFHPFGVATNLRHPFGQGLLQGRQSRLRRPPGPIAQKEDREAALFQLNAQGGGRGNFRVRIGHGHIFHKRGPKDIQNGWKLVERPGKDKAVLIRAIHPRIIRSD